MILGVHYEYIHVWSPHTSQVHFRLLLITWNIPLLRVIYLPLICKPVCVFLLLFQVSLHVFHHFSIGTRPCNSSSSSIMFDMVALICFFVRFFKFSATWRRYSMLHESICDDHDINFLAYILCTLHKPCWCYEIWLMWRIIFHRWQIVIYCFHF